MPGPLTVESPFRAFKLTQLGTVGFNIRTALTKTSLPTGGGAEGKERAWDSRGDTCQYVVDSAPSEPRLLPSPCSPPPDLLRFIRIT